MASFFSPKSRAKARSIASLVETAGQADHPGSFDCKSTFSKMRKKRPPPICISVENGNVILTGPTPTSTVVYADPQWPSTPKTPHTAGCTNPRCIERDSGLLSLMQPPFASSSQPWLQSAPSSNPSTPPQRFFPMAELPGSVYNPMGAELATPATPRSVSFDYGARASLESPLSLVPSSAPPIGSSRFRDHSFEYDPPAEPTYNGKVISEMDFEDLMSSLPYLSPKQIQLYWRQAMQKEAQNVKSNPQGREQSSTFSRVNMSHPESERLSRLKAEYDIQLEEKKNEICNILELHDVRMGALCSFISERHSAEIDKSNDPSVRRVLEIIEGQKRRILSIPNDGKASSKESTRIHELETRVSDLEALVSHRSQKLNSYQSEHRILQRELDDFAKISQRQKQEIKEKNAQINVLNSKVTQLVNNMVPSVFPTSSPATSHRVEKELPSPLPCSSRKFEKSKQRRIQCSRTRSADTTTGSNSTRHRENLAFPDKPRRSTVV
ncbi:hypothetical protein LOZ51_005511 [Ophidiomyces ophidiicola]|nr:hypothetical protein LOZ55_002500 [Ophidiomyces ophidiicola]KAI1988030.1 hypothetical protein LOZ51_005511 [Ophidiomyces ophidiicola]KAI1991653.1 hypothetical protein LOZ54_002027 [Ophidiomyces ophidiicola]